MNIKKNKNFCIIAHIDHGKSTLSDRFIELAGNVSNNKLMPQMLDSMPLEREKGITIKLNFVKLDYQDYQLNLIDTPGHADFSYEVSRSLSACEGAILLIDATQGIQAQTISNYLIAKKNNLHIIPVINKVDMPLAEVDSVLHQLIEKFEFSEHEVIKISAKTGLGCKDLLNTIIEKIPTANSDTEKPLKALIFDVLYDKYKGAIIFIRVFEGKIQTGDKVYFMQNGMTTEVVGLEIKTPEFKKIQVLQAGEVGCFYGNIKNIKDIKIGDTVTLLNEKTAEMLPGFENVLPMIFSSFYPQNTEDRELFKLSIERLSLSDSAFVYTYESSLTLGFGARCGFLGLLHLEIIKERLMREFDMPVIISSPSVKYEVALNNNTVIYLTTPSDLPDITQVQEIREPFLLLNVFITKQYIGTCMKLFEKYRATYLDVEYTTDEQLIMHYEIPLSEIVDDFYDQLKSVTNGYGSVTYELLGYQRSDLVKVDVWLNGQIFPQLSFISEKKAAYNKARNLTSKIKELISPHLFEIPIQAAINKKVISRETIKSQGKNVTAKCYGGDITRKRKLWEAQKKGKKKLKLFGKVELSQDFFEKVYKK